MTSNTVPAESFPVLGWPDLHVGRTFRTRGRTITEADVTMFAATTGDFSQIHVNRVAAADSVFGQPVAHGLLVLSYAHGLMLGSGVFEGQALAFLGIDEWVFRKPVFLGDTIAVDFRVAELRPSTSKPDRGIVRFDVAVVNGDGEIVQQGIKSLMFAIVPEETHGRG
ncbi:MaoC/PaaZ C-terminal domain-containing protein [Microbacterium sp. X-17]|uniref:MaoC/PaaZ C-terminal domain-containing protein n=1 Tax=Microbacterium sp. X-17 TaxID=3144404 RepID=UPI0031F485D9